MLIANPGNDIYITLGRFELAEQDLSKALELNPNFSDARRNLDQVQADIVSRYSFNAEK